MQPQDKQQFIEIISGVYEFYHKTCTPFTLGVWWEALHNFDLPAIKHALNAHCVNTDVGQYLPKPADVVRTLRGSSLDSAMRAWSMVEKAVRSVGGYQTVVFDDPLIMVVIEEMGGWIALCATQEVELPFRANEFTKRYRGYRQQPGQADFPNKLPGRTEHENTQKNLTPPDPMLIGDPKQAVTVYQQGNTRAALSVRCASDVLPALTHINPTTEDNHAAETQGPSHTEKHERA